MFFVPHRIYLFVLTLVFLKLPIPWVHLVSPWVTKKSEYVVGATYYTPYTLINLLHGRRIHVSEQSQVQEYYRHLRLL